MKNCIRPDIHGPRFRKKGMRILHEKTIQAFKEKYPEYKDLSSEDFKNIINTFHKNLTQAVVENRNGIELPEGLGFIFIGSCPPPKKKCIDYKTSAECGKVVTFKNWDSDNRLMKIFYTNTPTKFPFRNKNAWAFSANKEFKKKASDAFRENYTKYVEVLPNKKIATIFNRYRSKGYLQNLTPIVPEGYNEFKL